MAQTDMKSLDLDPAIDDMQTGMDEFTLKRKHGVSDDELPTGFGDTRMCRPLKSE